MKIVLPTYLHSPQCRNRSVYDFVQYILQTSHMNQYKDQHISDFDMHDSMDSPRESHTLVDNLVVLQA